MRDTRRMMVFERITFLLVAGTLGLFFLAFVFGVWGAILTLYPGLGKSVVSGISASVAQARRLLDRGREYAHRIQEYGSPLRTAFRHAPGTLQATMRG